MITRKELIKKYLDYFKSKGHTIIPGASLIPENDPTVLFTTAGMQPLIPYFGERNHPLGKKLANVQKCIRTVDFEEVGDTFHHSFFEMLGNWSLGDYWKKEAIEMTFEFLTKILKIPKEKLAATVFIGDKRAPKDTESEDILRNLGFTKERIAFLKEDNWWEPGGETGPCGPNTELFYWKPKNIKTPKKYNPHDERWVEIGNNVLIEYQKNKRNYTKTKRQNIDFGGGVERILAALGGLEDNYLTEVWQPIIKRIEKESGKKYKGNEKTMRIIADHIKAVVFLFDAGVEPGHKEKGYVLKRLIRRAVVYGKKLGLRDFTSKIAESVFDIYPDYFPKDDKRIWFVGRDTKTFILEEIDREEAKFNYRIEEGLKTLRNMIAHKSKISSKDAFLLYQSYGFPVELTQEIIMNEGLKINIIKFARDFEKELTKHQELSRTASAGKFKSGLADNSEATTKLHTVAHLLLATLKKVLKDDSIIQKGSNITPERLRLDFSFPRKLEKNEIQKIENEINKQINKKIKVVREEMSPKEAFKKGASGVFSAKYPDIVSVYTIGNISKEICTGPHVGNIGELGKFKIKKETSSSSGVRRIKGALEKN